SPAQPPLHADLRRLRHVSSREPSLPSLEITDRWAGRSRCSRSIPRVPGKSPTCDAANRNAGSIPTHAGESRTSSDWCPLRTVDLRAGGESLRDIQVSVRLGGAIPARAGESSET